MVDPTYQAVRAVWHDATLFRPGETIPLTRAQAAPLLALGAVETVPSKAKKASDA